MRARDTAKVRQGAIGLLEAGTASPVLDEEDVEDLED
jgi:hypothetical protein